MSVEFFEGGAGTGKTTSLINALQRWLEATPLGDEQSILALTFMHGSRHRLNNRLAIGPLARQRHECITIDSFAWHLVCRWRGLLSEEQNGNCDLAQWTFDERCAAAARLLAINNVRRWVCRRFPVVIADELQDVQDARLKIIQALAEDAHLIAAADEFQDLGTTGNNAAVEWLRGIAKPNSLSVNHRTACPDLLASAADLRSGRPMPNRNQCTVLSAANSNAAAGMMACNLVWFGIKGTVVLTPTGPNKSKFVREAIDRLCTKPIKPSALKKKTVGPFRICWESHVSADASRLLECLNLTKGDGDVETRNLNIPESIRGGRLLQDWVDRQRRVFGRQRIQLNVLKQQVDRVCQQLRVMRPAANGQLAAMTFHQAKNREFDRVIVLWPYEVTGLPEKVRRLLYNAITRAKQRAAIIVQNPPTASPNRLTNPPFGI